jgi:hypothetical protein
MKLVLVKCKCARCGHIFDARALPDGAYGEFLLWSKNGGLAYLNAFEDPTLKEVDNILACCGPAVSWTPLERSAVLHRIFGRIACDPDDEGAPFEVNAFPACPACGGWDVASWEFKDPAGFVEMNPPVVTHHSWATLSENAKREKVRVEVS